MSKDIKNFYSSLDFYEVQNKIKFFKVLTEADIKILETHYYRYYLQRKEATKCDKIAFKDYFLSVIIMFIAEFKFETDNNIYLYINSFVSLLAKIYNIAEQDQKDIIEVIKQVRGPYKKENFDMNSFLSNPINLPYTYAWYIKLQIGYYIAGGIMHLNPNTFTYQQLNQTILLLKTNEPMYREFLNFTFTI